MGVWEWGKPHRFLGKPQIYGKTTQIYGLSHPSNAPGGRLKVAQVQFVRCHCPSKLHIPSPYFSLQTQSIFLRNMSRTRECEGKGCAIAQGRNLLLGTVAPQAWGVLTACQALLVLKIKLEKRASEMCVCFAWPPLELQTTPS